MVNPLQGNKKTLVLIQLLRAIASLLVVLMHITVNYQEKTGHEFLFGIFKFGGSGVDIFFVLSGFIITYSNRQYLAKPASTGKFLKRRFVRIFPIYWLIITALLILQLALPACYNTMYSTDGSNLLQTYLLLPGHLMLNGVSWSLSNELFFYLLFTLALIIPNKKFSLYLMTGYFILLLVLAFGFPQLTTGNPYKEMLFFPMNIEFLLGILIVLIIDRVPVSSARSLLVAGIVLFIAGALLDNAGIRITGDAVSGPLNRVLLFGVPSFLIILAVVKLELNRTVKMHNRFLQLGDASYSIYLFHLPVVAAFFKMIAVFRITDPLILFLLSCILIVLVCAAGIFIYQKIEKPLIQKLNLLLR